MSKSPQDFPTATSLVLRLLPSPAHDNGGDQLLDVVYASMPVCCSSLNELLERWAVAQVCWAHEDNRSGTLDMVVPLKRYMSWQSARMDIVVHRDLCALPLMFIST